MILSRSRSCAESHWSIKFPNHSTLFRQIFIVIIIFTRTRNLSRVIKNLLSVIKFDSFFRFRRCLFQICTRTRTFISDFWKYGFPLDWVKFDCSIRYFMGFYIILTWPRKIRRWTCLVLSEEWKTFTSFWFLMITARTRSIQVISLSGSFSKCLIETCFTSTCLILIRTNILDYKYAGVWDRGYMLSYLLVLNMNPSFLLLLCFQ